MENKFDYGSTLNLPKTKFKYRVSA